MQKKSINVLMVEDNEDHAELIVRSLDENRLPVRFHHVSDGEAALDYLFRRGDFADPEKSPRPSMVLLDLRLPKVDGLEVLNRIKNDQELNRIPVVVLTTSEASQDLKAAYDNRANSYLVKPLDFDKFTSLIDNLGAYWLELNVNPSPAE